LRHGLTIAQLSAGWQMRDPLGVRRFELRQSFGEVFGKSRPLPMPMVTLEPYAIHSPIRSAVHAERSAHLDTDLTPAEALAHDALTSISSYVDVLLDGESVAMTPTPGWVGWHQQFTDWLRTQSRDAARKRDSIRVHFLSDLTDLMYLTCGAAYADYLVGERHLIGHIRNAYRHLGRPCNAYRHLREFVPQLNLAG
jgi:hypothetical protein